MYGEAEKCVDELPMRLYVVSGGRPARCIEYALWLPKWENTGPCGSTFM
jgi:hypothetical protein